MLSQPISRGRWRRKLLFGANGRSSLDGSHLSIPPSARNRKLFTRSTPKVFECLPSQPIPFPRDQGAQKNLRNTRAATDCTETPPRLRTHAGSNRTRPSEYGMTFGASDCTRLRRTATPEGGASGMAAPKRPPRTSSSAYGLLPPIETIRSSRISRSRQDFSKSMGWPEGCVG